MKHARTSHRDANSRLPCEISIRSCCVGGCLLIAETDKANAEIQACLSNVGDRKTRHSKDDLDTEVVERSRNDLCSGTHDRRRSAVRDKSEYCFM